MRLTALKTLSGFFHLFEVPAVAVIASNLGLDMGVPENQPFLERIVAEMIQAAAPEVSGLVLEPAVGLEAFLAMSSPLNTTRPGSLPGMALRVDVPHASALPSDLPEFSTTWGVEHIRNNYGVAVLELWYHPSEEHALQKKQIVGEIGDFCRSQDIDFILKLNLSTSPELALDHVALNELQLTAIQELRSACQLLALQPPTDPLAAATLTAELDIPWIVDARELALTDYTDALRVAMDNGAAGAMSGTVIWQDMAALRRPDQGIDQPQLETYIAQEIPLRLKNVGQVINETVQI